MGTHTYSFQQRGHKKDNRKQAGDELCQAQFKRGLSKLDYLVLFDCSMQEEIVKIGSIWLILINKNLIFLKLIFIKMESWVNSHTYDY